LKRVEIDGELITLGQFLKFAGIVDSGGDARALLDDEGVLVNGDIEVRRGRKLRSGDVVSAFSKEYLVTRKSV
jgi:ribosome-associated protein